MNLSRRLFAGSLLAGAASAQEFHARITNLTAAGQVSNPYGLRLGPDGDLYICEIGAHRISKLNLKTKQFTVVLDGQKEPYDLRFDQNGLLYFVDMPAHQVLSLDLKTRKLTVVAGTGSPGFGGDGGPAVVAQLKQPHSIAFNGPGELLICDIGNHRIRAVDLVTGLISTFAGTGEPGTMEDGAARAGAPLNGPRAMDFNKQGSLYIALREGNRVYRLDPKTDRFRHVAGTGEKGYSGDSSDARRARLSGPKAVCCAADGSIYLADTESHTIRRISTTGIITTVAGTGVRGDGPLGDPLQCRLSRPHGVFAAPDGRVFIGDSEANAVRQIA